MLLFRLGNSRYAIPVADVVEVAPRVELDALARAPEYVAGLFNYRGRHAPVIDLCQLMHRRRCADSFTSRIVMVDFPLRDGGKRTLGLLAEQVTETVELDPDDFSSTGLRVEDTPWLDQAAHTGECLVQQISIAALLPDEVQAHLFSAGDS
jgi:chemotaxis-related protein WspB